MNNIAKANGIEAMGNGKYRYIYNSDDLARSFCENRKDLSYPLLKESMRQRYLIANTEGLQKAIAEMCSETIAEASEEMTRLVSDDIVNSVTYQLNNLVQMPNGTFVSKGLIKSSKKSLFADALAKGLVKGVGNVIDDMINPKDNKRT